MKRKVLSILLLTLLLTAPTLRAANAGRFYAGERLSSGLITCICQDKYGYIWIGTEYGLNRFDGYRFTQYLHSEDSTSIVDNDIASLYVDSEGTLWVGCARGLVRYDYDTDRFGRYRFPDNREPRVNALTETGDGKLLIGTTGYGLYSLRKGNSWTDYEGDYNRLVGSHYYSRLFIDRRGCLWQSSHLNDLTRYNVKGGKPAGIETYQSDRGQPMAFVDYAADAMLIVCRNGIMRYNYQTGLLTDAGFDLGALTRGVAITDAFLDSSGNLLIGTTSSGLMIVRRGEKRLRPFENQNPDIDLGQTCVSAIAEDRSGNLWTGCYRKGLLTVSREQEAFETWSFAQQNLRTGGSTSSIAQADDGGVWCTVKPGGVYKMAPGGRITAQPAAPPNVEMVYRDRQGRYWLGTDNTLCRYQPELGTWTEAARFEGRRVNTMTDDGQGRLYVSVFGTGLAIYDTATGKTDTLSMREKQRPEGYLCNNWIHAMTFDSDGNLWIATSSGVAMMKPQGRVFNAMGWNQLLEGRQCYALCQMGPGGDILLGMSDGLYVYHFKTNKAERLDGADPLQDKLVCGMIADPKTTTVWIATNQGIWEYDYHDGGIVPHVNGNGLTAKEYTLGAAMYADGRIYFGTGDGITVFSPQRVQESQTAIGDVRLTGITVNGRPLNPLLDRFQLSYRENSLALAFSLLDFRNPENISYEWRINGASDWMQTSEGENRITLNELHPGVYNIEVRATNNGLVSEKPHLVRIIIDKPWYKSALAYLVYIAIALGFLALVLYNFERQRRRDLEETKMRFLINATHDIRSPLTLIMGPLEKAKEIVSSLELRTESLEFATALDGSADRTAIANSKLYTLNSQLESIDKNAQRLLLLVNQILDERKIDKGQMRLSCRETNLNEFVGDIVKLYAYNAQQRNITYTYEQPEEPVTAWIDRINFDKVVSNLLSNAFKYTFDGGSITVSLSHDERRATIRVTDSGMGFEDDKTERFFERFYQGKNSKDLHIDGTGIGLNLSRTITELHGGTVTAQNRKDGQKGAILTVSLPLGKDHLKPEEIEEEEETGSKETRREDGERKRQASRNLRILLVDDDAEIGRYISSELGTWYHFDYAENGREALKRLLSGSHDYDLVISDIMMPEMDGISLLRSIKQNPNISHVPVILLTSKSEVAFRLEGLKKGADAYLAKPFNMEELHILIDNLVDNVRRLRGKFTGTARQEEKVDNVEVKGNNDVLMEKVMKVINAHLSDSDLNIDLLTREVGISRAQLHRKMKEITGISTSEFIRNIRMEQAARLIKENKINITQVAYSVGFTNQAHFSTVFKKYFGVTPSEYTESQR